MPNRSKGKLKEIVVSSHWIIGTRIRSHLSLWVRLRSDSFEGQDWQPLVSELRNNPLDLEIDDKGRLSIWIWSAAGIGVVAACSLFYQIFFWIGFGSVDRKFLIIVLVHLFVGLIGLFGAITFYSRKRWSWIILTGFLVFSAVRLLYSTYITVITSLHRDYGVSGVKYLLTDWTFILGVLSLLGVIFALNKQNNTTFNLSRPTKIWVPVITLAFFISFYLIVAAR